jgi:hypothetical protein
MIVAIAMVGWGAGPARAAFPGRNGLLAVQPLNGAGLTLVRPSGAVVRRICDQASLCGIPVEPRWSPDGHSLVFLDASSSRIGVVAVDGTCLWCLLGTPLTTLRGSMPAFTRNGKSVTFPGRRSGTPRGVWRVGLATGTAASVVTGAVSNAVWSSTGELAIVRHGAVWVRAAGRRQRLRRIGAGTAPSWSPVGSKLAVARSGSLWVLPVKGGARPRRLARGNDPAWSPDGREIAYIGAGGTVRILPARGGRSRSWSSAIRGRSLDWQPVSAASSRSCSLKSGFQEIASSAQAVVASSASGGPGAAFGGWYGCLRAVGRWRLLEQGTASGSGYVTTIPAIRLAGRFALLFSSYFDKYMGCSQSLTRYDLANGTSAPLASEFCSYPQTTGLGSLALDSSGFSAWRATHAIPLYQSLNAVSCPSISLCVAVDQNGSVASSTNPTGGRSAWRLADVDGTAPLSSVSCPTTGLCVAVAGSTGNIVTSTDPTGGPGAWVVAHVDSGAIPIFFGGYVSCPSTSLCVLADGSGNVLTSTHPTGGPSGWTSAHVLGGSPPGFSAISCPSSSLCAGLDEHGDVVTSTDPTGGASAWTVTHVDSATGFLAPAGISCPSNSLCVAVDGTRNLLSSSNPTGGTGAWTVTNIAAAGGGLSAISCPSTSLCVVADTDGDVLTSTNPTGGSSSWQVTNVDGSNALTGVSCGSDSQCIATDARGNVLSSAAPAGGSSAWSSAPIDVPDCAVRGTPCIVEQLYSHDDHGTQLIDGTPPGEGRSLATIALSGNGLALTWTHDGLPQQRTLG